MQQSQITILRFDLTARYAKPANPLQKVTDDAKALDGLSTIKRLTGAVPRGRPVIVASTGYSALASGTPPSDFMVPILLTSKVWRSCQVAQNLRSRRSELREAKITFNGSHAHRQPKEKDSEVTLRSLMIGILFNSS